MSNLTPVRLARAGQLVSDAISPYPASTMRRRAEWITWPHESQ